MINNKVLKPFFKVRRCSSFSYNQWYVFYMTNNHFLCFLIISYKSIKAQTGSPVMGQTGQTTGPATGGPAAGPAGAIEQQTSPNATQTTSTSTASSTTTKKS